MNQTYKYFTYARKSQDEKDHQILSIPAQRQDARDKFPDLITVENFEESASAFTAHNRPIFDEMITRIKNSEADGIIAWHPDRLSRNALEAGIIIDLLDKGIIKDLKFTSYTFENTPEGKMLLGFMLSQSKYFSDKLSKDIQRGNKTKLRRGGLPGKAPQGYINVRIEGGDKIVEPDEPRYSLLKRAWRLLLSGTYTVPQILIKMTHEWGYRTRKGNKLSRSALYSVFTNEFYAGWIVRKEGRFKGKHQAMITLEEFEEAQRILGRPGKPKPQKRFFSFTGMIQCGECGGMITAETKLQCYCYDCKSKFAITKDRKHCPTCNKSAFSGNRKILNYSYYRCSKNKTGKECSQPYIRHAKLEKQIQVYLESIQIPKKFTTWLVKWLKYKHQIEIDEQNAQLEALQMAYGKAKRKLDNLIDMRLNEEVTEEKYQKLKLEIERQRDNFKEQLDGFEHRVNQWVELTEKTLNFATKAPLAFQSGDLEQKRQILATIGSNLTLTDETLGITPYKPFEIIHDYYTHNPSMKEAFEPKKKAAIQVKEDDIIPPSSVWCWV